MLMFFYGPWSVQVTPLRGRGKVVYVPSSLYLLYFIESDFGWMYYFFTSYLPVSKVRYVYRVDQD